MSSISKTTNTFVTEIQPQPWRITTNSYRHHGLQKGDIVYLSTEDWQHNGAWLMLQFNNRYHLRELQLFGGTIRLQPLCGQLQPIDWPLHVPLPVVGRVVRMERNLEG